MSDPANPTSTPSAPADPAPATDAAPVRSSTPDVPVSDKMLAFWKNWWALLWRSTVVAVATAFAPSPGTVLVISGIVAAVLAFGLKVRVRRRAVLGLLLAKSPVAPISRSFKAVPYRPARPYGGAAGSAAGSRPSGGRLAPAVRSTPAPVVPRTEKVTNPGRITGYEPRALDDIALPTPGDHPLMEGSPGSGLSSSGFDAKAIELGQAGETNFAKALSLSGALDKYATFWSVNRPDWDGNHSGADVDCIILTASTLWLLDMKFYKGGDATYKTYGNTLHLYDTATGHEVGAPKKMSRNMEIADDIFSHHLVRDRWSAQHKVTVQSRVLLIPTNAGAPTIDSNARWTGGIRIENLDEFLNRLNNQSAFDPADPALATVRRGLRTLVK